MRIYINKYLNFRPQNLLININFICPTVCPACLGLSGGGYKSYLNRTKPIYVCLWYHFF